MKLEKDTTTTRIGKLYYFKEGFWKDGIPMVITKIDLEKLK